MRLPAEQRAIAVRSAPAILITASAAASAWLRLSPPLLGAARDMATADRLAYALQANLPVFLWLGVFEGGGQHPVPVRRRPAGSADAAPGARLALPAAVLQNSLEQTVLAVSAHLVLATVLRGEEMILLPVLVPLYLVGRGFFALGYAQGAAAPAFGMALTGASTIAAFGIAVVLMGLGR